MALKQSLNEIAKAHKVVVVYKRTCPFCVRVFKLFDEYKPKDMVTLDANADSSLVTQSIQNYGQRTVPVVFINGKHIGGCDDTMELHHKGLLKDMLA